MALNFATVVQVAGTAFAIFGDQIIQILGIARTPFIDNILDGRVQLLGISLLVNSLAQSLAKTDAFEIFVNGKLVFSKLEKKRMPTLEEILEALDDQGVRTPISDSVVRRSGKAREM